MIASMTWKDWERILNESPPTDDLPEGLALWFQDEADDPQSAAALWWLIRKHKRPGEESPRVRARLSWFWTTGVLVDDSAPPRHWILPADVGMNLHEGIVSGMRRLYRTRAEAVADAIHARIAALD